MKRSLELQPNGFGGSTFRVSVTVDDKLKRRFKDSMQELRLHPEWIGIEIGEFEYDAPGVAFNEAVLAVRRNGTVWMRATILDNWFTGMVGTVEGLR